MKPKRTFPNNTFLWILVALLVISGIIALVTAFSGGNSGEDEVNAVYTNAAATLAVQQMTLQASAPSATATTFAQTPTATVAPLASPTLFPTQGSVANPTSNSSSGAVGCNNSVFVTDVTVPDNTAMTPGQTFTKTWKLQNTGTCPWTTAFKVSFVSGNAMGGVATALTTTVQPGQSGDISVAMTAPATAGDAQGTWILTNDSGQNFGTTFYVLIKVGGTSTTGTAVTGTPGTATATSSVSVPVAASDLVIEINNCTPNGAQYEYTPKLTWKDNSNNEQGFNIYVNGVLADIAPAGTESYQVKLNGRVTNILYDAGTPITYSVEAFNAGGKAAQANVIGQCPLP